MEVRQSVRLAEISWKLSPSQIPGLVYLVWRHRYKRINMSKIEERTIESWADFDQLVRGSQFRRWIFRGQIDASWKLECSVFRSFEDVVTVTRSSQRRPKNIARVTHESISLKKFIATARQYDLPLPLDGDPLEWLAVMQHYGAPTRLLDATFSPYVAAAFALESGTKDAAVYCFREKVFREVDEEHYAEVDSIYREILSKDQKDVMYVYEPRQTTPRLLAQQGLFLVPGSLNVSHERIVEAYNLGADNAIKLIIPRKLRSEGVHHLRRMNITSTMLFPGIEGFCKSFRHQPYFLVQSEGRVGELEKV